MVDVDYVLIDDVNYDQTTRLNHTVLADQMTPVRIIGSTLSKKKQVTVFVFYHFICLFITDSVANSWKLVCGGLFGTSPDRGIE